MYLQTHEYKHEHVCACTKWLLILLVFLLIMKPTNKNCGALLKKESMCNYSFCIWQGLKKGGVKISVICKPWLVCWVEIQRKKYFKSYFDHSICRKNQLPSLCIFFLRICFSLPVSTWRCSSSVASFKAFPDCLFNELISPHGLITHELCALTSMTFPVLHCILTEGTCVLSHCDFTCLPAMILASHEA